MFGLSPPYFLLYVALQLFSVLGAAFALWKGGRAERWAAIVVVVNVAVGYLATGFLPDSSGLIRLINDGSAALALLAITLIYGAPWMGGVMLFYAAQFALHSYFMVTGSQEGNLRATINNINWNGVIWCLIIGTAMSWRARIRAARRSGVAAP